MAFKLEVAKILYIVYIFGNVNAASSAVCKNGIKPSMHTCPYIFMGTHRNVFKVSITLCFGVNLFPSLLCIIQTPSSIDSEISITGDVLQTSCSITKDPLLSFTCFPGSDLPRNIAPLTYRSLEGINLLGPESKPSLVPKWWKYHESSRFKPL